MMKVRPRADYPVRVAPQEWEVDPPTESLYKGIFDVTLNRTVDIVFVPDVTAVAPPWDPTILPADMDDATTQEQTRLDAALHATYIVTPNPLLAHTDETLRWARSDTAETEPGIEEATDGVVFYVSPAEFESYTSDLQALSAVVGRLHSNTPVSKLRHYSVIGFVQERIVGSPRLHPRHAELLGRPPAHG
jgi:hypothetical protein